MAFDSETWLRRLAKLLIRNRFLLLLVLLVVTGLAAVPASRLQLERSIESLYAPGDPHLREYLTSKGRFLGDEFVIVAYTDPELLGMDGRLTPAAEQRVTALSDQLSNVPGVQKKSTRNIVDALNPPFEEPAEGSGFAEWIKASIRREWLILHMPQMRKLSEGMLIGEDGQTTGIVLRLLPESQTSARRGETFKQIRELADNHTPPAYVVGEPVQIHDMFEIVENDGRILFLWSVALLALVIVVLFRSVRWMMLPIAVVFVSITWTEAILVLSGLRLSMVSSMLNSLVTIVGIAVVMHVTLHFREQRRTLGRLEALETTCTELTPAVFWACATTAAGFGALLSSGVGPVSSFGTMMAIGAMMVLVASGVVLPGGILLGEVSPDPGRAPAEHRLTRFLERTVHWVHRRRILVGTASVLLTVFTTLGLYRLKVETDFSANFRKSSPIIRSLDFVEEHLGGAGTWEVNFPAPPLEAGEGGEALSDNYLQKVRSLADRLRELEYDDGDPQLTKVVAVTDLMDLVPGSSHTPEQIQKKFESIGKRNPEFVPGLYNSGAQRMRIVLRALERQPSEEKIALINNVEKMAAEEFGEARTTGLFVLLAFLIENLLHDQLVSFSWASASIGIMMLIAFRSWRLGLICTVPNLLPIVVLLGMLGWLGVPVNIGTAMIASVSIGLTVDSSIHYVYAYNRARKNGMSVDEALHHTQQGVGLAIVLSTLALMIGFSVLLLSNFKPLGWFGGLVSAAMFGGLLGNLILLPLLLRWADKPGRPVGKTVASKVAVGS